MGAQDEVKKKRAPHKNSVQGCRTCKNRHVKCDETRPSCLRCTRARISCGGYEPLAAPGHLRVRRRKFGFIQHPLSLSQQLRPTSAAADEHRSLDFFFLVTIPLLSQDLPPGIWESIRDRVAAAGTTLNHTAIALSLRHKSLAQLSSAASGGEVAVASYEAYRRALASFQELLSRPKLDANTAALTCLLLVTIESLAGNKAALLSHLHAGLSLLPHAGTDPDLQAIYLSIGGNALIQSNNIALLDQLQALPSGPAHNLSQPLDLATLCRQVAAFVPEVYKFAFDVTAGNIRSQLAGTSLQQKLLSRSAEIEDLVSQYTEPTTGKDSSQQAIQMLHALLIVATIMLKSCITRYQQSYDAHSRQFRRAIDLCTSSLAGTRSGRLFSLGLGIIPTLQLIGLLCRDACERRKAVDLLKVAPQCEGISNAAESRALVEAVIAFEELDAEVLDDRGLCAFVPEHRRVHLASMMSPSARTGYRKAARLLYKPYGDAGLVKHISVLG